MISKRRILAHTVLYGWVMMNTTPSEKLAPSDWTDLELLPRLLKKEGKAWREFHRRFDRLVYRCIHKVTSRFRSVVTEDDVQDIFAQFLVRIAAKDFRKLRQFSPDRGTKLGTWLGMIATNVAWDHLRSVARRPSCVEMSEVHEYAADCVGPFEAVAARETWAELNTALANFSAKDQRFVKLYYVDGLSPEEVAETMNVSVKTVYSKKHKIRTRLRAELRAA